MGHVINLTIDLKKILGPTIDLTIALTIFWKNNCLENCLGIKKTLTPIPNCYCYCYYIIIVSNGIMFVLGLDSGYRKMWPESSGVPSICAHVNSLGLRTCSTKYSLYCPNTDTIYIFSYINTRGLKHNIDHRETLLCVNGLKKM